MRRMHWVLVVIAMSVSVTARAQQAGPLANDLRITPPPQPEKGYNVIIWVDGPAGVTPAPEHYQIMAARANPVFAKKQADGSYLIPNVRRGHFTLETEAWSGSGIGSEEMAGPNAFYVGQAQTDFDVMEADVTLHVAVTSIGGVQGVVKPNADSTTLPRGIRVTAREVDGPRQRPGMVSPDGTFGIGPMIPGRYVLELSTGPDGVPAQSVKCNGVVVTKDAPLVVGNLPIRGCELMVAAGYVEPPPLTPAMRRGMMQPPNPQQMTGLIAGRVVRADGGTAIAGATVELMPHMDFIAGMMPTPKAVKTDSDGRYRYIGLVTGNRYELTAYGAGFLRSSTEAVAGSEPKDMNFQLTLGAVVHGTVRTAEGRPADAGITVTAVDVRVDPGGRTQYSRVAQEMTDAQGRFTLRGLPVGSYAISVNEPVMNSLFGGMVTFTDGLGARNDADRGGWYPVTWFGDAATAEEAKRVEVPSLSEFKTELKIAMRPDHRVKVVLLPSGPEGGPQADSYTMSLLRVPTAPVQQQPDGSFVIDHVPPGHYTLMGGALGGMRRVGQVQMEFEVKGADLTLPVKMGGPGSVRGVMKWEGPPGSLPEGIVLGLEFRGERQEVSRTSPVAADGSFYFADVLPGNYVFGLYKAPAGGYAAHDVCNGVVVDGRTPLVVGDRQDVTGCEVTAIRRSVGNGPGMRQPVPVPQGVPIRPAMTPEP